MVEYANEHIPILFDFNMVITNLNKMDKSKTLELVSQLRNNIVASKQMNNEYANEFILICRLLEERFLMNSSFSIMFFWSGLIVLKDNSERNEGMIAKSSLTILFENPFWIGLYERIDDDKYEVCKITFGAEPKDYEVYDFLLDNWHKLKFSPPVKTDGLIEHKISPKRMQRKINKQLENRGIGAKAQQALKLQHERSKVERKAKRCEQKDVEKKYLFALRQEKKKAKHRGR